MIFAGSLFSRSLSNFCYFVYSFLVTGYVSFNIVAFEKMSSYTEVFEVDFFLSSRDG